MTAAQCLTDLEHSNCSQQRDTKCNWRDTKYLCPQGGDTKLIASLFEGPKHFRFPLSQYKNYSSYVLSIVIYIVFNNSTFP